MANKGRRIRAPRMMGTQDTTTTKDLASDRADGLREAANDAAKSISTLYATFLLIGVYVAIAIGGTTDDQLLRIRPMSLPLLNASLPIVGFFAFIPWLMLLFHFYLLLQFYLLARTLHAFGAALAYLDETDRRAQQARLFSLPFSHMLIGRYHAAPITILLGAMVWITTVVMPLTIMLWAQIRFLPYHDVTVTWVQRSAIIVDALLLWIFWPVIMTRRGRWWDWWKWSRADSARGALILIIMTIIVLPGSLLVAVVPGERVEDVVFNLERRMLPP